MGFETAPGIRWAAAAAASACGAAIGKIGA
jgi:hypothetical protein